MRRSLLILVAAVLLVVCHGNVNHPPDPPSKPDGPATGHPDSTYTFTTTATDPDGDSVCVRFDWGDGDTSDWSGLFASGETAGATHVWTAPGSYAVSAQAQDAPGALSEWSEVCSLLVSAGPGYPDSIIAAIPLPEAAGVCVSPDGRHVYAVSNSDGLIAIDASNDSVVAVMSDISGFDVEALPDGEHLCVCHDGFKLVDTRTWTVDTAIISGSPHGYRSVWVPSKSLLYTCGWSFSGGRVRVFDVGIPVELARVETDAAPIGIAAHPDGEYVYATIADDNRVKKISTSSHEVVDSARVLTWPVSAAVSPDGSMLAIANGEADCITVLDPDDLGWLAEVQVGDYPSDVAFTPDGAYILVADDKGVCVIRTADMEVASRILIQGDQSSLALLPEASKAYVTSWSRGLVTVLGHRGLSGD